MGHSQRKEESVAKIPSARPINVEPAFATDAPRRTFFAAARVEAVS